LERAASRRKRRFGIGNLGHAAEPGLAEMLLQRRKKLLPSLTL